jgi:Saxitoxin biosynthesis operon protein SxtJ
VTTIPPSDRHFGLVFTVLFAALAVLSYFRSGRAYLWLLPLSALTGLVMLLNPELLRPLNRLWMKLASLLHAITSPVILAVIYFLVVTPFGLIQRLMGRDVMRQKFDPRIDSYWISREPPGPPPESLRNQF